MFDEHIDLDPTTPKESTTTKRGASIKRFDSLPKQQSERGWCTSFAVTSALENLARQRGKRPNLSEVHHWSHYEMYQTLESAKAAVTHWITEEKTWPYRAQRPREVDSKGIARAEGIETLKHRAQVFSTLDAGLPIAFSTEVTGEWYRTNGFLSAAGEGIGGHAVELVGYEFNEKSPGGGYFTIKNSWGRYWGDHGYGYIPFSYCSRFYCSFIKINGLDLRKSTEPDSQPNPTPKPMPSPTPNKDGKITQADFSQMISYGLFQHGAKAYQVALKASPDVLRKIRTVRYNLSAEFSFPPNVTVEANPEARASGFQSPLLFTPANAWRTNGAIVTLESGETISIPGMAVRW